MNNDKRKRHYEATNKGRPLTPRQLQRLKKRNHRENAAIEQDTEVRAAQ